MSTVSKQETFDFVVGKIREQGKPSLSEEDGRCKYRGPNGLKCAAGHLISDLQYSTTMEGSIVATTQGTACSDGAKLVRGALIENGCDLDLVRSLQRCHDGAAGSCYFMQEFENRIKLEAEYFGLVYTPNKELTDVVA